MICLKTRTFAVSQTTNSSPRLTTTSCDLLENSYFCSIANNCLGNLPQARYVVICLKTRTFAVSQTTASVVAHVHHLLWFAWKLVLLQYRKQLQWWECSHRSGCDLLENSYFCSIANNKKTTMTIEELVVICLKTRTFAVSQTTPTNVVAVGVLLWFAWKLVLLQYRKQRIILFS